MNEWTVAITRIKTWFDQNVIYRVLGIKVVIEFDDQRKMFEAATIFKRQFRDEVFVHTDTRYPHSVLFFGIPLEFRMKSEEPKRAL